MGRKGVETYPPGPVSNLPWRARLDPKRCQSCFAYTFLEVRRETKEGE
jgi:hypothetical protein